MSSRENQTILSFINQMLMEEEDDMENTPSIFRDSALQATEQSLYEAIHPESTSNVNPHNSSEKTSFKKNHHREDDDSVEYNRSTKHLANNAISDEIDPLQMYNDAFHLATKSKKKFSKGSKRENIDLGNFIMQCAQAIANSDTKEVISRMVHIRRHSSPHGTSTERVAHYFANAIEARLSGSGTTLHASLNTQRISGVDALKLQKMLITSVPFINMIHLLGNGTVISKLVLEGAATLHIIDFGILFGFQWPSLILALSERPGGPPKLRITGIDYPQTGFRPAQIVMDTGVRLAEYCRKFGVPFEYNAIAKKFEDIGLEDLKIEKGEFVVVNSINRLQNVTDLEDAVNMNVPRDDVLRLIRRINPNMFFHAVINARHIMPSFVERYREAFIHFSSMFDMFETAVSLEEDQSARVQFEDIVFGRCVMSVVACEGVDRMERPETYKGWQLRTERAGFRQIPLDGEIVKRVRLMKEDYAKGFLVGEDGEWILLGWKGCVVHGVSCWQPVHA